MTIHRVRLVLVLISLGATAVLGAFLLVAPSIGYPLRFDQALRLLESVTPTFAGLLGSATIFLISGGTEGDPVIARSRMSLLSALAFGPIFVFATIVCAAFFAFYMSNRATAAVGTGMSVDNLAHAVAFGNGILAATTAAVAGWLFGQEKKEHE
jgi:hypothetical protein